MSRVTKGSQPSEKPVTTGISSFHVHEVAWDCIVNKTKPDLNDVRDIPHQCHPLDNASDELKADRAEADTAEPVSHSFRCVHCNVDMGVRGPPGGPPPLSCAVCSARPFCSFVCAAEHLRDSCAVPHWMAEDDVGTTPVLQINDTFLHCSMREHFAQTTERYSIQTAVQSWGHGDPDEDPPKVALLFKEKPGG